MTRHERLQTKWYFKDYCALRAEQDKGDEANRKAYGHSAPAYQKPEAFRPELWAKWCRDRPNAINVVAWRERSAPGLVVAPEPSASVSVPSQDMQLEMFV